MKYLPGNKFFFAALPGWAISGSVYVAEAGRAQFVHGKAQLITVTADSSEEHHWENSMDEKASGRGLFLWYGERGSDPLR